MRTILEKPLLRLRLFLRRSRWFVLLCAVVVSSCGSALKEEEAAEREKVYLLLRDFYVRDFPIVISSLKNQGRQTNFAYLEEAIPETLGLVFQSMENDYTLIDPLEYVKLRGFPIALEDRILSAKVSSWETYREFVPTVITQTRVQVVTNNNLIQSNTITNLVETNVQRFRTNLYEKFLENELPGLLEDIARCRFSWKIEKPIKEDAKQTIPQIGMPTNQVLPDWTYGGNVQGRLSVRENKMGPSEVEVRLEFSKIVAYQTNRLEMVIRTTEDKLYEEIMKKRGDIRRFYLGGELVDVEVVTDPEDANVYFDGVYIGRSPLMYEGVRPGSHNLQMVKEGFAPVYYTTALEKGGTNLVQATLQPLAMTGVVSLEGESNRLVFLDSLYRGTTPLTLSNISLGESHILLIRSDDREYQHLLYTFTLTPEKSSIVLPVGKGYSLASRRFQRNVAWGLCFGGWGLTVGFVVGHFYTSSLMAYYQDQLSNPNLTDEQQQAYASQVVFYEAWKQRLFSYGILSSLVSMGLTVYALYQERVYVEYDPASQKWGLEIRQGF